MFPLFLMFNRHDMPQPSERFEAALDMLVDDELSEESRRELLQNLEQADGGWQTLAIRFLERQVERRAIRSMVQPAAAQSASSWRILGTLRIAATLLITASIFGLAGLYVGHQNHAAPTAPGYGLTAVTPHETPDNTTLVETPRTIQFINAKLPPDLGGSSVQVPVIDSNVAPAGYPFVSGQPTNVMIVPDGPNQAVAFPVVPASNDNQKQKVY